MIIGKATRIPDSWENIVKKQGELAILGNYLPKITKLPTLLKCPYRTDKKPSLGLQFYKGHIVYKDFATGESGGLLSLIKKITGKSEKDIRLELDSVISSHIIIDDYMKFFSNSNSKSKPNVILKIHRRVLNSNDIKYWQSYGINAHLLSSYDIHPIDYYWVNDFRIKADELAYTYRIVINGNVYYKIYQPLSKEHKWVNNYPRDTISLEKYISNTEKPIIICSSVKDALCLKHNIEGLDVCALQGEGYKIPVSFKVKYINRKIFILFDNDKAGINYSTTLSKETNIPFLEIPQFDGGKDISDLYKVQGKEMFTTIMSDVLKLVMT